MSMELTKRASVPVRYHRCTHPRSNPMSAGQGSTGNVIAAVCSFFIPGLGQLVQGRLLKAIIMFVLAAALWIVWLGWIVHLWSILDAALYKPQG
jgi:TM2 domain-containing membrane protein YozV